MEHLSRRLQLRGYTVDALQKTLAILLSGGIAHGPRMTVGPVHQAGAGCIGVGIHLDPGGCQLWVGDDLFDAARLFCGGLAILRYCHRDPVVCRAEEIEKNDQVVLSGDRAPGCIYEIADRGSVVKFFPSFNPYQGHAYERTDLMVRARRFDE